MKKVIMLFIVFLLFSTILTGCTDKKETTEDSEKLTVYTTVYPLQYFTERIAGDLVTVKSIYPPGADEHTFEPSQRDMMSIADANVFFYIGLGLEGFVEKAKTTLKNEGVEFVQIGEKVNLNENEMEHEMEHDANIDQEGHDEHSEHGEEQDNHHEHGDIDPHIWLDPIFAKDIALAIKNELIHQLPEEEEILEENYQLLENDLEALHLDFQSTIQNAKRKEVIVSHAAFGYWEKRYGLKQLSISGLSSATEPSQKDLEEIVKEAKAKNLNHILFEQNVSSKLGEIIQHELGAKPLTLHNLATLTDENLQNNETYFTLMNQNIESLRIALNE